MSRLLSSADIAHATPIDFTALNVPVPTGFRARFADGQEIETHIPMDVAMPHAPEGEAIDPIEQARADAFAEGFQAGARTMRESLDDQESAAQRLAEAVSQLAPAQSGALSNMISQAVLRLVSQIVGDAPVDAALLQARVESIAAFIEAEQGRNNLHLHPDDIALLGAFECGAKIVADADMPRGGVRLDSGDGWIEDGPDVRMAKLKALLDDMGAAG